MKQVYHLVALSFALAGLMSVYAQGNHLLNPVSTTLVVVPSPVVHESDNRAVVKARDDSPAPTVVGEGPNGEILPPPLPMPTRSSAVASSTADPYDVAALKQIGPDGSPKWCIEFTSDVEFYYTLQPSWGTYSGNGKDLYPCFDNNATGGEMYLGTKPNPGRGNTKLQCTFQKWGANCDVSLLEGYSVSVECKAPSANVTFGTGVNLWSQAGVECPNLQGDDVCLNTKGRFTSNQADVPAFFQPAYPGCQIWVTGHTYAAFGPSLIECHVSGGGYQPPVHSNAKRKGYAAATAAPSSLEDVMEPRDLEDLGFKR